MERPHNAAHHIRREPFNGVGMNRTNNVFTLSVVNECMGELRPELGIADDRGQGRWPDVVSATK